MSRAARLARYSEVCSSLALLSDRKLGRLVDDAGTTGSGIGGTSAVADVAGVPVFVKRVPLTDLERRPGSVMSTANLFGLPVFCQYGAGGPGWLGGQLGRGQEAVASACTMVERNLRAGLAFMNGNGLLHFDAHFGNILTDGQDLYFADLGLATSPRFDLSAAESDFAGHNRSHDVCYALTQLVNWLVSNVCGVAVPATGGPVERNDYIRRCAAGAEVVDAPAAVAEVIRRYSPAAVVMNDFYWDLFGKSRATPYPAADIKRALAAILDFPDFAAQADTVSGRLPLAFTATGEMNSSRISLHRTDSRADSASSIPAALIWGALQTCGGSCLVGSPAR
jgi:hypothetical protein